MPSEAQLLLALTALQGSVHLREGALKLSQVMPDELAAFTTAMHWANKLEERAKEILCEPSN
jgi:hypothetical protein